MQIRGVEETRRHRDEIRIRDILVSIGVGESPCLAHEVHAPECVGTHGADVERREDAQHLQHRDAAGRGRRHAADTILAIGAAHRVAQLHAIAGEVRERHVARMSRRRVDRGDDVARDLALVERARAAGCDALAASRRAPDSRGSRRPRAADRSRRRNRRARAAAASFLRRPAAHAAAATPRIPLSRARSRARTGAPTAACRDACARPRARRRRPGRRPIVRRRPRRGIPSAGRWRRGIAPALPPPARSRARRRQATGCGARREPA